MVNVEGVSKATLYDVYYRRLSSLFDPMRRNENVVEAKESGEGNPTWFAEYRIPEQYRPGAPW